ncbi:hypothetical protein [Microbaculum marinum]|uniref:Uncharacterized protein n=1 Tax=Microbaculum marinum TaxID=1764581 RepID=A0AAW9RH07_9HYPH
MNFIGSARFGLSAAIGGLAMIAASASMASAETVEYRGVAKLYKFSQACLEDGYKSTEKANFRYRPPNVGDNGPATRFAFHFSYWATGFIKMDGDIGDSFVPVIGQGFSTNYSDYGYQPEVRFTQHAPSKVKPKSKRVKLRGDIQGFSYLPDCSVKFRVNAKRR